ncbi:phytoene desaturase [bacterium]|nr:phytoene desaturase [bacterium]
MKREKILVVGGGAGGLSSALSLQSKGFQVEILEQNETIGGKLNCDLMDGYTFDTGPSILTLPGVLEELFRRSGADLQDYLELKNLDPQWRCFFHDGFHFDFRNGEEQMIEEVSRIAPEDVDGFVKLMKASKRHYQISQDNFFFRDYGDVFDVIKSGNAKSLEAMKLVVDIDPLKFYSELVEKHIRNPHLKQALEHLPQYIGSSPFLSPAILSCLIYIQFNRGCWYPMGGMNQISKALAKRFEELGGIIHLGQKVSRVQTDTTSVRGFETEDRKLWTADEYVVNMDANCFNGLVGLPVQADEKLACSGVTVFLGLKKRVKDLAHHNFFFSRSHRDEFRDIYDRKLPHQDPTVYVCVPSLSDPSVAPKDRENVFLLIHSPIDTGSTDWDSYLPHYVDLVKKKLAGMGFDATAHDIEVEFSRSPRDIGKKWSTYKGNIYGQASHGRLAGAFKQKNQSHHFRNLQFAGGTVNPGAGVPMSIMSGMIAGANLTKKREEYQGVIL